MNKELLKKELRETLHKHGLDIQYMSIDHEKIANDFFTANNGIWDSSEYWLEDLQINKINWLLSDYGKKDLQLNFVIGDYEPMYNAVYHILKSYMNDPESNLTNEVIESEFGDFEKTTLEDLKAYLSEKIFNEILDEIIESIAGEEFSRIEEYLPVWFDIQYPEETFNELEALSYWTIYFQPKIENEELAWKLNLIPFWFDDTFYLALGGCGMDLSPKLDAYQALTDGTVPSNSMFRNKRDHEYAKHIVREETFNKVIETIKCDPTIHIQTEVFDG